MFELSLELVLDLGSHGYSNKQVTYTGSSLPELCHHGDNNSLLNGHSLVRSRHKNYFVRFRKRSWFGSTSLTLEDLCCHGYSVVKAVEL